MLILLAHLMEGRQEHTACAEVVRIFPGGHFFVQTAQQEFLDALWAELRGMG